MRLNKIFTRPYNDFKNPLLWKRVDKDWVLWYQCVDFARYYMYKLLWVDRKMGNAKDWWNNRYYTFDKSRTRIWWTNNLMQWDIIFTTKWRYGHVAIFDRRVGDKIYVLEQNGVGWGNGKWGNAVRLQAYNPTFRTGVWRCPAIEKNYKKEVEFINNKILTKWEDKDTLEYLASIRYQW